MRTALTVRDADGNDKTYEADGSAVTMGLCMDLLQEFRADLLIGGADDPEAAARDLTRALMSGMVGFYPYAARLFPGLTEEEYRTADPAEAVGVLLPPQGSRDHIRVRLTGEIAAGATDGLALGFADWPNLTILDETTVPGNVWDRAGEDSLTGLFFRILRDGAKESDPDTAATLELAARIGRKILEGREVELP